MFTSQVKDMNAKSFFEHFWLDYCNIFVTKLLTISYILIHNHVLFFLILNRVLDPGVCRASIINVRWVTQPTNQVSPSLEWAGPAVHEYPISVLAGLGERGDIDPLSKHVNIDTKHICIVQTSLEDFASTFSPVEFFCGRKIVLFACVKMSVKAAVTGALQPNGDAAAPASEKSFVLKKIMDIPPPNILEEGDDGKSRMLCG